MNWAGPEFVLWIVGLSYAGWLGNSWIRARHGYALEDEWGGKTAPAKDKALEAMAAENAALRQRLDAALERIGNVERIVTDRGFGLAGEIEDLRRQPTLATRAEQGERIP